MRKPPLALLACASLPLAGLLLAGPVLAQSNITPESSLRLPEPAGSGLSVENQSFIDRALGAAATMTEAGRLAARSAHDESVRRLGGTIATDEQSAREQITQIANAKKYKPRQADSPELAPLEQLKSSGGDADFDRRYLTAQHQASRWLVSLYQTETASTQDLDLRTFAASHALMLRKHLDEIQNAAKTVGLRLEAPGSAPQY
jgi:predicted outer membrane protein